MISFDLFLLRNKSIEVTTCSQMVPKEKKITCMGVKEQSECQMTISFKGMIIDYDYRTQTLFRRFMKSRIECKHNDFKSEHAWAYILFILILYLLNV